MRLTHQQLNRATLARQLLLERVTLDPAEAARRVTAIQAQEPASVYLSLWNRIVGFDPAELDAAYAARRLLRSISIRITLHTVHADDYQAVHAAMVPNLRASRLNDRRFTATGLTAADADAALPDLLAHLGEARSVPEIETWLADRFGDRVDRAWWALKTYAPIVHDPDGGPWAFRTGRRFRAAPEDGPRPDTTEALAHLFRRYLEGFGPASPQDFGLFAMQRQPAWTAAIAHLGDELVTREGPDGRTLYDVPGGALPDADVPAPPRLLPMWDNVLLAYVDRSRIIPDAYRSHVIRRNGDTLATLLVDGMAAGAWRAIDGAIEIAAFHELPRATWSAIETEAAALVGLLADRDPDPYGRYRRWWDQLPAAETRLLGS